MEKSLFRAVVLVMNPSDSIQTSDESTPSVLRDMIREDDLSYNMTGHGPNSITPESNVLTVYEGN